MYPERKPPSATSIIGSAAHFAAGQTVYKQGDRGSAVFEVLSGLVMTGRCVKEGRRRIVAFHGRGDSFGFDACGRRGLFAEAVSDCSIAAYHKARDGDCGVFPGHLLSRILHSIAQTRRHTLVLRRRSALARVAAFLVDRLEHPAIALVVEIPMTRRDLASYLGLAARTVSLALERLESAAVIEMPTRRQVRVIDLPELLRLDA